MSGTGSGSTPLQFDVQFPQSTVGRVCAWRAGGSGVGSRRASRSGASRSVQLRRGHGRVRVTSRAGVRAGRAGRVMSFRCKHVCRAAQARQVSGHGLRVWSGRVRVQFDSKARASARVGGRASGSAGQGDRRVDSARVG